MILSIAKWKLLAVIAGALVVIAGALVHATSDQPSAQPQWNAHQRAVVRSASTFIPDQNYLPK